MSARLGLALGGGAARGLAHLGVLEVLLDEGIVPRVITGTSFGALAGGAVAARGLRAESARAVCDAVVAYARSEQFRRSKLGMFRRGRELEAPAPSIRDVVRRGLLSSHAMPGVLLPASEVRSAIEAILPDVDIEALPCAFGAVAADLVTGEELLVDSGSLRVAVRGSCAIPGLMDPVDLGGRMALDGGWADKVPAGPARLLGAECVVAVDVSDELEDTRDLVSGLNVVHRGDAIRSHRLKCLQLRDADLVVACDLRRIGWADFELAASIIESGRQAARRALPLILAALDSAGSASARAGRFVTRVARRLGGDGACCEPVRVRAIRA